MTAGNPVTIGRRSANYIVNFLDSSADNGDRYEAALLREAIAKSEAADPKIVYRVQLLKNNGEWVTVDPTPNHLSQGSAKSRMDGLITHNAKRVVKVTITETEEVVA